MALALAAAARRSRRPRGRAVADARRTSSRTRGVRSSRPRSAATRRGSSRRCGAIPGQGTPITGSVLLERALGGAVTLLLAGVGFLLALGRYPIGAYLWPEAHLRRRRRSWPGSSSSRAPCAGGSSFALPLARRFRVERPARAVYEGIHGYRDHPGTLLVVCAVSVVAAADARPRDLRLRPRGRDPPLAAAVHRARAAALPRHARAVHRQRARRARGVLRQLPREPRRRPRRGVCLRLPLLRDDDLARAARARGDPVGAGVRPARSGSKSAMPERSG